MSPRSTFVLYGWLRLLPVCVLIVAVPLRLWLAAGAASALYALCIWRMRSLWRAG